MTAATAQHSYLNMFGLFGHKPASPPPPETRELPPSITASDKRTQVIVGTHGRARTWRLHTDLLSQHSSYFAAALESRGESEGSLALENQDPAAFTLFVDWLYSADKEITVGGTESELESTDPWVAIAHTCYDLGERLESPQFARYSLVKFMQGVRFANPAVLIAIFDGKDDAAKEHCPLRKFTAAWLWYIRHTHALLWTVQTWWISDSDLADPVCGPLVRRMLKEKTFQDFGTCGLLDKVVDPHWLDFEHWYSECSANPLPHNCRHVPFPCNIHSWGRRKD